MRPILLVVLLHAVVACSPLTTSVERNPHKGGLYILSYDDPFEIASDYGEGLLLSKLKAADNSKEVGTIYQSVMNDVIAKFVLDKGLIPAECTSGVELLAHSRNENSHGFTSFKCKRELAVQKK